MPPTTASDPRSTKQHGRAVHLPLVDTYLPAPGLSSFKLCFQLHKLCFQIQLSNFAFIFFRLRHYTKATVSVDAARLALMELRDKFRELDAVGLERDAHAHQLDELMEEVAELRGESEAGAYTRPLLSSTKHPLAHPYHGPHNPYAHPLSHKKRSS